MKEETGADQEVFEQVNECIFGAGRFSPTKGEAEKRIWKQHLVS